MSLRQKVLGLGDPVNSRLLPLVFHQTTGAFNPAAPGPAGKSLGLQEEGAHPSSVTASLRIPIGTLNQPEQDIKIQIGYQANYYKVRMVSR